MFKNAILKLIILLLRSCFQKLYKAFQRLLGREGLLALSAPDDPGQQHQQHRHGQQAACHRQHGAAPGVIEPGRGRHHRRRGEAPHHSAQPRPQLRPGGPGGKIAEQDGEENDIKAAVHIHQRHAGKVPRGGGQQRRGNRGQEDKAGCGQRQKPPLPQVRCSARQHKAQGVEQAHPVVDVKLPRAVKGGDHPVDDAGHHAHQRHGGEQDQGRAPLGLIPRGIGQRIGQHPVPGRSGHQKHHQEDAGDDADEENDVQGDDALDQELEQHRQGHSDAGGPSGAAAALEGHGVVVVNAAPDVAAGEQAQRGAQGKEGGLIGGQEQDGGDHAQRPRQEGGVFPPPPPPGSICAAAGRTKSPGRCRPAPGRRRH